MIRVRVPVAILLLLAAGCSSSSKAPASSAPTGAAPTATVPATSSGALKIAKFAYDPTPLTVTPGQQVTVANADSAEHTVTSDMAGLFAANEVKYGKSVTFTAPAKAGSYTFHCAYHANMHGTLIVKS
jgi:plastocyanin